MKEILLPEREMVFFVLLYFYGFYKEYSYQKIFVVIQLPKHYYAVTKKGVAVKRVAINKSSH